MKQDASQNQNINLNYLIIAIVVVISIVALVFLGEKNDIDLTVKTTPKNIEVHLKTKKETREPEKGQTGEEIVVDQKVDEVRGEVTGVNAKNRPEGDLPAKIRVEQNIGSVGNEGRATGIDLSQENIKQ